MGERSPIMKYQVLGVSFKLSMSRASRAVEKESENFSTAVRDVAEEREVL